MVLPVNDPIMLDISIWLFGYIYYQNPSITWDFIGSMEKKWGVVGRAGVAWDEEIFI